MTEGRDGGETDPGRPYPRDPRSVRDSLTGGVKAGGSRETFLGALDVSIDLPLATPASRSLAYFIDLLVLALIATLLLAGALMLGPALVDIGVEPGTLIAGALIAWFMLEWVWFVAWETASSGLTPGKQAMGLRVVRTDGRPVGLVSAIVRNLLRPIDTLGGGLIGLLVGLLTARHQRLGDLAAGTVVVHAPELREARSTPARWPDGIGPDDVALVEAWFDREPILAEAARDDLATRMLAWVERSWPGFATPSLSPERPAEVLRAAFDAE